MEKNTEPSAELPLSPGWRKVKIVAELAIAIGATIVIPLVIMELTAFEWWA
jgi:hypothetical protein